MITTVLPKRFYGWIWEKSLKSCHINRPPGRKSKPDRPK